MNRTHRPFGTTALSLASVAVGLYSQVAAMAMLLGGVALGLVSAAHTTFLIAFGAVYLGLMVAAYVVGFGFWMQRHWSWTGGVVVFGTLIGISTLTALVLGNLWALAPAVGGGVAIAYLWRQETRERLAAGPSATTAAPAEDLPVTSAPESMATPATTSLEATQTAP
jgi:hypothetical protein